MNHLARNRFVIAVAFCGAFWIALAGTPIARAVFGLGPFSPDEQRMALHVAEARCVRVLASEIVRATGATGDRAEVAARERCEVLFDPAAQPLPHERDLARATQRAG